MSLCSLSHFLRVVYVVLWFSGCEGFLFPPREDEEVPVDPGSASYVNSSEFLAKWLEDPRNREIVAPITDYVTETIDPGLMTNSPDAYYVSKYNTNVTLTTLPYVYIETQIKRRLQRFFQPPDSVNFTFVKALFIPLTQPKLMYRTLIVSDKFCNMSMFERHNLTSSIVNDEMWKHAMSYRHELHLFVFTHDEWKRKRDNFMEEHSTLFYRIPKTAEVVTFGPYGRRKKRSRPEISGT